MVSIAPPRIQFRHIALLLLGGTLIGSVIAFLAGLAVHEFTRSNFVTTAVFGITLYATLVVGYHWTSQERGWIDIRARFPPAGRKPLILGALGALAIVVSMSMVTWVLRWAGVQIAEVRSPIEMENWTQLPLAFLFIVVAAPLTEELFFRGLLLDWLKEKTNVWAAAALLSVIFSLLHANPFSLGAVGWLYFVERFLLGLGASALTINYQSLRPALVMHATLNAIALVESALNYV